MNSKAKNLSKSSVEMLYETFDLNETSLASLLLRYAYFIDPRIADQTVFPNFARLSREHHPGVQKGQTTVYQGQEIKIFDNLKARNAFSKLSGERLNGKDRTVEKGWEVAHIWGHVHDPRYFTAGWNMCLMPNFLRDLTEEQNSQEFFQKVIQQASFELFFRNTGFVKPKFVTDQGIILHEYLQGNELNLLGGSRTLRKAS